MGSFVGDLARRSADLIADALPEQTWFRLTIGHKKHHLWELAESCVINACSGYRSSV